MAHMENLRLKVSGEENARREIPSTRTQPPWLERSDSLPFEQLSSDEFEILSYLLLLNEKPEHRDGIFYYGKTKDLGRDIFIITSEEVEVIQCKHYKDNVSIGEVRWEMAKLFVNVHKGAIHPKPSKITFYISKDLTSPATDLLVSQEHWLKNMDQALEEFLGEAPNDDLIAFCKEWWPKTAKEDSIKLTHRLKPYDELIDEFFTIKKVVTQNLLNPICQKLDKLDKLDQINDLVQSLLLRQQRPTSGPEGMQELIRQLEAHNPGFSITAQSTNIETTFIVQNISVNEAVIVEAPSFPDTEAGNCGREKFRQLIEEGREIEFLKGEVEWAFPLKRGPWAEETLPELIKIGRTTPKTRIPVTLRLLNSADMEVATIGLTYLSLVRMGTKEMEIAISGGQLAGQISIIASLIDVTKIKLNLSLDLTTIRAVHAYGTLQFLNMSNQSEMLDIVSAENGDRLFRGMGIKLNYDKEKYKSWERLSKWLVVINTSLGKDYRYPKNTLTQNEINDIERAAIAIEFGEVSDPTGLGGELCISVNKEMLTKLMVFWEIHQAVNINAIKSEPFTVLEDAVDLGPINMSLVNALPKIDIDELLEKIQIMDDDEALGIPLSYETIIYTFDKFKKP